MKTLKILLTIEVPDEVTPEMIDLSHYKDGYYIGAFDAASDPIAHCSDNCWIEYCIDPMTPTVIFLVWGVGDFEDRALDLEGSGDDDHKEDGDPKPRFDRSKFPEALHQMDHDHDANNGITWETIDYYLEEYCLLTTDEFESLINPEPDETLPLLIVVDNVVVGLSQTSREPMYENDMCKSVGMMATCNCCDRIIFVDENYKDQYIQNGGYCKECKAEMPV